MTNNYCEWRIDHGDPCDSPARLKVETVGGFMWVCATHYDEIEAFAATLRSFGKGTEEEIDYLNR